MKDETAPRQVTRADAALAPPEFIRDDAALAPLAAAPRLALDTEADTFYRYDERICLIQLSTPEADYMVDPLEAPVPPGLLRLLAEGPTVVLHGGDFDVRAMFSAYGLRFGRILDTSLAARLLGLQTLGLKPLLEAQLGVVIDKGLQRSDWGRRPLSAEQLAYARQDTRHLLPLMAKLEDQLEGMGRLAWLHEECERQRQVEVSPRRFDPDSWRKIKGSKQLGPDGRRALKALQAWRDAQAQARQLPPFRVVRSDPLLRLAKRIQAEGPRLLSCLNKLRLLPPGLDLDGLAAAVEAGLAAEDPKAAPPPDADRQPSSPEAAARLDGLREGRARWATRLRLDPGFLLPMTALRRIARQPPADFDALAGVGVAGWRAEVFGAELLELVSGPPGQGAGRAPAAPKTDAG